jgi:uncharacterized phage protein (TIGR02218 family)
MKTLPPGLQAHLDSGSTTLAWCWRITRTDGVVLGFTDHDRGLAFDGTEFEPDSGLVASEVRAGSDLAVDAQDAEGALTSGRITETDILDGRWDNAAVDLWRVNWEAPAERVLLRRGNIGEIRRGRTAFVAEVRSLAHYLNQTVGRTYQFHCDAAVGDARCGVDLDAAAFSAAGTVTATTGDRGFTVSGALDGFEPGWFDLGRIDWTSGANAGRRAEIASHGTSGGIALIGLFEPPVRAIAPGDGFILRAGCDKRFATCRAKFANAANFRGFPVMPGDDVVVRYPNRGDANSGAPLVPIEGGGA